VAAGAEPVNDDDLYAPDANAQPAQANVEMQEQQPAQPNPDDGAAAN